MEVSTRQYLENFDEAIPFSGTIWWVLCLAWLLTRRTMASAAPEQVGGAVL